MNVFWNRWNTGMLPPDTLKAAGISWMSLVEQKISCKELNSVAIEVQITASRLLSRGDEQRKFTSPLILLSPEAGCRWELKAVFPFPPQRLSLLSLKRERNPRGDPNPWNSSSCAFLLSQIINYHALYIHCTSNSKNSTKLPPAGYLFPRNMNILAVGWVVGEPSLRVLGGGAVLGMEQGQGRRSRENVPWFCNHAVTGMSKPSAQRKSSLRKSSH